jgi:hypothetical protein
VLLRKRPLLIALLVLLTVAEASLGRELAACRFDWRPLWQSPVVKATMLDFTFTAGWCALYLMDTARRQGRNGWAWLPLLLIMPSVAMLLFSLTGPGDEGVRE